MNLQNQPDSCLSPSLLAPPGRALVAPAAISSHFEAVFLRYLLAVKTSPVFRIYHILQPWALSGLSQSVNSYTSSLASRWVVILASRSSMRWAGPGAWLTSWQ